MNRLDTARRFSLFLARNLDSGKLKPEIFLPMLDKVLTEADFQAFADWDKIRAEENEEELARQLRELRRYVVSQIIVRDINRISDLNEVTRTITLFADFAVNTALDFSYAYYQDMYGTPIGRYTKSPQHLSVVAMGKAGCPKVRPSMPTKAMTVRKIGNIWKSFGCRMVLCAKPTANIRCRKRKPNATGICRRPVMWSNKASVRCTVNSAMRGQPISGWLK